jgi:hypothetical protein
VNALRVLTHEQVVLEILVRGLWAKALKMRLAACVEFGFFCGDPAAWAVED